MTPPTPRTLGYRMPAEWEPQEAVWLAWPTNRDTWPGPLMDRVRGIYADLIRLLSAAQRVCLLVNDADAESGVAGILKGAGVGPEPVHFFQIPTVDTWIRDYGPTFLVEPSAGRIAGIDWEFNAWGHKYPDLERDDGVAAQINSALELGSFEAGIVLEGGSIEVNGRGTLLVTEQCLLNPNRNPHLGRAGLERHLREFLGVSHVLWLAEGIAGDDTDGHIDDIARFVDPETVLAVYEEDPSDANHALLKDNHERLSSMRDQDGERLRILTLPMPDPITGPDGRLPASYANFYIGNDAVVVPVFGQEKDAEALDIIQSCFPHRRVAGIDCTAMVHGLGAIHCCTQQQPRARRT